MRKKIIQAACLILVGFFPIVAGAQLSTTSTLNGRITDPQGAVIAGAQVEVTQKGTGIRREARTNDEGLFVLTNLAAGEYEVKAQASGFGGKLYPAIVFQVGQSATLDITLEVGTLRQQVDVVDNVNLVNTTSSVVDGVVNSREIERLPLNGRNYLELALLIPGNSPAPNFAVQKINTLVISSAGQLGRSGNVTIDGADNYDDIVGGPLQNISQDAVQEFQITTNRFTAEFGRSGSSIINVVTKSGTNDLHGSASFFWRDRRLQGLPATFDRRSGQEPPFDREQYAFTLGGPLVKDRAWWFGSFEYRNQDGAALVGERDVASRTIRRTFAPAPLNDLLVTGRGDWRLSNVDQLSFRYSLQREDDVAAADLIRAIGTARELQFARNKYHLFQTNWTRTISPSVVNSFSFSVNNYITNIVGVAPSPQLNFPSIQDGSTFRVPQVLRHNRVQFGDTFSMVRGAHHLRFGGEVQRIDGDWDLGAFQQGRIEIIEDFASADRNGDGRIDDNDILFAATLRKRVPETSTFLDNLDNTYLAFFVQDDWRGTKRFALNLGLRYEIDTDTKNLKPEYAPNPIIESFRGGERMRDLNNWSPRVGFNWATANGRTSIHGGYGIYYERVVIQLKATERALDGRNLAPVVRAGSARFIDPSTGRFLHNAPTLANPFTGPIIIGQGASGINFIESDLQNPMVQQMNLGIEREFATNFVVRADFLHNYGTHFIIGRRIGTVFNPTIGGIDRVVSLESSVKTKYDGLLTSLERRFSQGFQFRASYTLSKAFNYSNDDQIPYSFGPIDPNNLQLEYGPTPNDQRHRFNFSGVFELPYGVRLSPLWTMASGVPADISLPDGSSRVPVFQRNAGGRLFHTGAELNAFIQRVNANGGVSGQPLPLVRDDARFNDSFNSFDLRVSKTFTFGERVRLEPIVEVFNLFNVTNVLGVSNLNYSGFSNVLVRDSNNPASPGFLTSSRFGQPVTTAGGVFGSGGPRAFQLAARLTF